MGIQGLLMELRPVAKRATLQDLAGKRAAVDALCWFAAAGSWRARAVVSLTPGRRLHRGIYTCALELGQGRESDKCVRWRGRGFNASSRAACAPRFVTYCRARMVEFLRASISVIFVFDGDRLPAKAGTEKNRHECEALPAAGLPTAPCRLPPLARLLTRRPMALQLSRGRPKARL